MERDCDARTQQKQHRERGCGRKRSCLFLPGERGKDGLSRGEGAQFQIVVGSTESPDADQLAAVLLGKLEYDGQRC